MKLKLLQAIVGLTFGFTIANAAIAADSVSAPQNKVETTALKAARMLDVKSGAVVNNPVILISNGKIVDVGSNLTIPSESKIVDLGDVTLLPGLIDTHTHLLQNLSFEMSRIAGESISMVQNITLNGSGRRALLGAAMAREDLRAGITTVRDLGNSGVNGDIALRDAIMIGWVEGPRIAASTRALSAAGGQFDRISKEMQSIIDQEYVVISGVESARTAVRNAIYDGADVIKVIVESANRVLTLEEMRVIVEEAHRVGIPVAAHATTDQSTRIAVQAGVNSIEHAYAVSDEVLNLMAKKGIFIVPTDFPAWYYVGKGEDSQLSDQDRARIERIKPFVNASRDRLLRAHAAGVKIAFGSDSYYQVKELDRGQSSLLTLRVYLDDGLKPIEVIRAATINAAELIGWQSQIGSIEKGKFADIIAVPGNPLENGRLLEKVSFVMKEGKQVKP